MGFRIACPNCGSRPFTEFWFGGEHRPFIDAQDLDEDFARVWFRENVAGRQSERWYHYAGCRRWLTVERDTVTNKIYGVH